ncbi:MAG: glycosyltransferase family 2 protein [Trueperaceae bacterium]|nr:glycosyltransferase family 2 protein [Trueperaceae bacterium]
MSGAARPRLSVVVPTYGRPDGVERAVHAWVAQRLDAPFEVVVVDDGSPDDTYERLERLAAHDGRIVPVRQPNRGAASARNAGLARARGDWILFADDDVAPVDETTVARWWTRVRDAGGAWVPRMRVPSEAAVTLTQRAWRERLESGPRRWRDGHAFGAGGFWFAALLVERAHLGTERFDEGLAAYGWEDMELGYRLRRRGVRSRLARGIEVWHADPVTLDALERKYESLGRQGWAFVARQPRLPVRIWTGTWGPIRAGKALLGVERRGAAARARIAHRAESVEEPLSTAFERDLHAVLEGAYARGARHGAGERHTTDTEVET